MVEDLRPALRPARTSLLPRRNILEQDRAEWAENVLVTRQRLGAGWLCAPSAVLPERRPEAREICSAVQGDGRQTGHSAGQGWSMAFRSARSRLLRLTGKLRFSSDCLWPCLRHQ